MDKISIKRGKFTVKSVFMNRYELYSHEYDLNYAITIYFYGVEKVSCGDILELPDYMLIEDENKPLFSNRLLQFCEPNDIMAIPKDFNIELDYAYITYKETGKKVLVQRCYGWFIDTYRHILPKNKNKQQKKTKCNKNAFCLFAFLIW